MITPEGNTYFYGNSVESALGKLESHEYWKSLDCTINTVVYREQDKMAVIFADCVDRSK